MAKKWIANAVKNKGGLHRALGVPEGENIPQEKLEKARHSRNPKIRRMAALAHTLSGLKNKKKVHVSGKHIMSKLYGRHS